METNAANEAQAQGILDQMLAPNTKAQYANKIKHFEEWIGLCHPECQATDAATGAVTVVYERVTANILQCFLGHISRKRKPGTGIPYEYIDPPVLNSVQHVNGYKSAIVNQYKTRRIPLDIDRTTMFAGMMQGYKRTVQKKKQDGEMSMTEGKFPLSFSGYRFLAKKAMSQTTDFALAIFVHVFLLFCWNMIARSVSVSTLMFQHFSWEEDSMVVIFPTTKSDKVGKNSAPIHIFANRSCPEICPIRWYRRCTPDHRRAGHVDDGRLEGELACGCKGARRTSPAVDSSCAKSFPCR